MNRCWIIVSGLLLTAAINLVLGVATSWASVMSHRTVPPWGVPWEPSIFWNVLGTLFLLPLLTCVFVTPAIRRDVRSGSLRSLSKLRIEHSWLAALPASGRRRGVLFGVLAPPAILLLIATGSPRMTSEEFIVSQTVLAVTLDSIFTSLIALYAMSDYTLEGGFADVS